MAFILIAKDKKDSLQLRLKTRSAHLQYLETCPFKIKVGGPLMENDNMMGTIMIFETGSYEDIQNFVANDPYVKAQLFHHYDILEMKIVKSN